MININSNEALMVWIINRLSELYPENAILKGGMVLRLLDCPRHTNDLDYVFVPFKSKKQVFPLIQKMLTDLEGAKASVTLHSTSLRININYRGFKTQIEANVANECRTEPMSTTSLAKPNKQLPRVISVMSFDVALAHKLAAWNERGLMRDLYDAYFFHSVLKIAVDKKTLEQRLQKIQSQKGQKLPKQMSLIDFKAKLQDQAQLLNQKMIDEELRDYLAVEERAGLDKKIKIALYELITQL